MKAEMKLQMLVKTVINKTTYAAAVILRPGTGAAAAGDGGAASPSRRSLNLVSERCALAPSTAIDGDFGRDIGELGSTSSHELNNKRSF